MINSWQVKYNTTRPRKGCVVLIPGRGNTAELMIDVFNACDLHHTMAVAIEPVGNAWYPIPKGAEDQAAAVDAQIKATKAIETEINKIQRAFNLKREDIVLIGFSAGGVMVLNMVAHNKKKPYKAAICMSGAILDVESFPECSKNNKDTQILLQHNVGDMVFEWEERYLPMRECLENNKYSVNVFERMLGEHTITLEDVILIGQFLTPQLGYENWRHHRLAGEDVGPIEKLNRRLELSDVRKLIRMRFDDYLEDIDEEVDDDK